MRNTVQIRISTESHAILKDMTKRGMTISRLGDKAVFLLKKEIEKTGLPEADQAMEYLQKAVDQGWNQVQQLETDPKFDFLRNRDDFRVLLSKLKKQLEKKP